MPILSLLAKLAIDGRGFKAGLKEAEVAANRFAGNLKSQLAAAFSVAATAAFLKNLADTVGRVKDLGDQYGITTDEVQKADVALKQNGLQFEQLGQSIQKVGQARREAVEGNMELRETFRRYGVTLKDLNDPQRRNYDLILQIAGAIRGQNITAREQVELTDLLGAKSFRLITTLQTLKDFEHIEIFSQHEIQTIDEANKKLDEMIRKLKVAAAFGIVEAARSPTQFAGDYLRSLPPIAPVPAGLNLIGQLIEKFSRKVEGGPVSPLDVVNANIEKSDRRKAGDHGGLFEVDKNVKARTARSAAQRLVDFPGAQGRNAAGAFSSNFISGFNPQLFIARDQLSHLERIDKAVTSLDAKATRAARNNDSGFE